MRCVFLLFPPFCKEPIIIIIIIMRFDSSTHSASPVVSQESTPLLVRDRFPGRRKQLPGPTDQPTDQQCKHHLTEDSKCRIQIATRFVSRFRREYDVFPEDDGGLPPNLLRRSCFRQIPVAAVARTTATIAIAATATVGVVSLLYHYGRIML